VVEDRPDHLPPTWGEFGLRVGESDFELSRRACDKGLIGFGCVNLARLGFH
jgi:hypothetical protein